MVIRMGGIFVDEDGNHVLTALVTPPPDFINVTGKKTPGAYLMGSDKFYPSNFRIVPIFNRQAGQMDEILLGILSVILIALITELIYTILLRTSSNHRDMAKHLLYASLIDETLHFRNIATNIRSIIAAEDEKITDSGIAIEPNKRRKSKSRRLFTISLITLFVTMVLVCLEVIVIVATQPSTFSTSSMEYNLRGFHPAGTRKALSKYIRRTALERGCTTPAFVSPEQSRNFLLLPRFKVVKEEFLNSNEDVSETFSIGSWYHRGGFDHEVNFGEAKFGIQMRTELILSNEVVEGRRVLFESTDDGNLTKALYVQRRTMYSIIEESCNKNFSSRTCPEVMDSFEEIEVRRVQRKIRLWRALSEDAYEVVDGLISTFRVQINNPFRAVEDGVGDLVMNAIIEEVSGPGSYEKLKDDEFETGIEGLLSEEGRIVGALMMFTIMICLFVVLLFLRLHLKPLSLGFIALRMLNDESLSNKSRDGSSNA